jgi:3-isopropylmalate/(R)-2-methylmalate dehydratase small subunit
MAGVSILRARAVPLDMANVDTDRIIPARFLKQPRGPAYRNYLFHDSRFAPDGTLRPGFPLDDPAYAGARILVADANFGIGSAREGAVWALKTFGIEAVIASSFGDVFRENCVKNGVLPVVVPANALRGLRGAVANAPGAELTIDLPAGLVSGPGGWTARFAVDDFERRMLSEGLDEIALTFSYRASIERFERDYASVSLRPARITD